MLQLGILLLVLQATRCRLRPKAKVGQVGHLYPQQKLKYLPVFLYGTRSPHWKSKDEAASDTDGDPMTSVQLACLHPHHLQVHEEGLFCSSSQKGRGR